MAALLARGAETAGPSAFYIVSESFSDNGPSFYYRVIDIKADGSDSIVRYTRVAPMNEFCSQMIVQSATARLRDTNPAQLVKHNNPCAVKPGSLHDALHKPARISSVFEAISFSVVAKCGASDITLAMPIQEEVDMKRLRREFPQMARLWNLAAEITDRVFGRRDIFHDRTEKDEIDLQAAGEKVLPELVSGQYDAGLSAAVKGNVGTWKSPSFLSLLSNYRGPVSTTEAKANFRGELLNAQAYPLIHVVDPVYPRLAMMARIQGRVELELRLDPATGLVTSAAAVSGHPLLTPGAIYAAKQWRFALKTAQPETVNVTLDFKLRCR